jgi:hypothetical protein
VPRLTCVILFLLGSVAATAAESSAVNARRAQALLGSSIWSRVITVENGGRDKTYPARVHALVFELVGRLWFYTDVNGTQSLSIYRNHLAADKADFSALLREIDPGFARYSFDPTPPAAEGAMAAAAAGELPLPSGCFIESVARWLQRQARGERVSNPRLLSFYEPVAGSLEVHGHTVLAYDTPRGIAIEDPDLPGRPTIVPARIFNDPSALAKDFIGHDVARAVILPLSLTDPSRLAVTPAAPGGAPAATL